MACLWQHSIQTTNRWGGRYFGPVNLGENLAWNLDIIDPKGVNKSFLQGPVHWTLFNHSLYYWEETQKVYLYPLPSFNMDMVYVVDIIPHGSQGHFMLHNQYQGWRFGYGRIQDINNRGIDRISAWLFVPHILQWVSECGAHLLSTYTFCGTHWNFESITLSSWY